jgi:cbb3-type cytochrome oxidase maturation protein
VSLGFLILLSLLLGLAAWLFFLWSVKSGQYDDPEGPKYRMMDDDDEPGGLGRAQGQPDEAARERKARLPPRP